jgi:hypothetical protein
MKTPALAYRPGDSRGPGALGAVELDVAEIHDSALVLRGVIVVDVRDGAGLGGRDGDLRFHPAAGGGPLASPRDQREAMAFGVVNVAYHLRRGLDYLTPLIGHALPPLIARIGAHEHQRATWGGGHYRLPAAGYSSLPETVVPAATGEIHLGPGGAFTQAAGRRYFAAPAHVAPIVVHELGHHLTRHTADFRLNERRPALAQANHKIPLDEGTADYLAAIMLGTPDIYGWHRGGTPPSAQARRRLDGAWTMAAFRGGHDTDPHLDGTVWAAALWSARDAVRASGGQAAEFDRLVTEGLVRSGATDPGMPAEAARRRRRSFGRALAAILEADAARGGRFGDVIAAAFAGRGIETGFSNADLRDRCRGLPGRALAGRRW